MGRKKQQEFYSEVEQLYDRQAFIESIKEGVAQGQSASSATKGRGSSDKSTDSEKGKHGHKPASEYTEAKIIEISHQTLKKGDRCPDCLRGKLFQLKPGSVIRIKGQPGCK